MKKTSSQGFIIPLIIIIIAALAIGGGAYVYEKNSSHVSVVENINDSTSTSTPTPSSSPTAVSPTPLPTQNSSWKVYTNNQFGYQIQYPSDFKFTSVLGGDNPTTSFQVNYPTSYFTGTNLDDARVTVETRNTDENSCYSGDSTANPFGIGIEKGKPALVMLNGIQFHALSSGDSAMGHNFSESYLSIYHNNICYSVVLGAQSFKQEFYDNNQPESKVANYDPDTQLFPMFMKIATTFKFISVPTPQPVKQSGPITLESIDILNHSLSDKAIINSDGSGSLIINSATTLTFTKGTVDAASLFNDLTKIQPIENIRNVPCDYGTGSDPMSITVSYAGKTSMDLSCPAGPQDPDLIRNFGIKARSIITQIKGSTLHQSQPTVTLISPNGGEKIPVGVPFTIKWKTDGFSTSDQVTIELQNTNATCSARTVGCYTAFPILTQAISNTGSYTWDANTVYGDAGPGYPILISGNNSNLPLNSPVYKIRIDIISSSNTVVSGLSAAPFTITQ